MSCKGNPECLDFREMWALEYEVDELQTKFAESIGTMDLDNLDVDFIEDMMLKAKPLQSVLNCIRNRQIVSDKDCAMKKICGHCHPLTFRTLLLQAKLEDVKKLYADQIKDLEAMKVTRPEKPVAAEKVRFDTAAAGNGIESETYTK